MADAPPTRTLSFGRLPRLDSLLSFLGPIAGDAADHRTKRHEPKGGTTHDDGNSNGGEPTDDGTDPSAIPWIPGGVAGRKRGLG
ncbi:MAG: hypothetical protein OEM39_00175 [Acidimicrobiia bacterium]|nr:hypothetical protein [Acidimicrobiia bacterium]